MNQKLDLDPNAMSQTHPTPHTSAKQRAMRMLLPFFVILLGAVFTWMMMTSSPRMERVAKPREARLVETLTVTAGSEPITLTAWGEVTPAQQASVKAQVSGVVMELLHPLEPGSYVTAGQPLLQLEKNDYESAKAQRQAELDQARANLEIERGNQSVARSEFALLGEDASGSDKGLMLREPQLKSAMAQVKSAEAALAAAELNLQRTVIRAPFAGVIRERFVNVGSHLAVNGDVLTLNGTAAAWVEVSVPVNELRWIKFPDEQGEGGSTVNLHYDRVWANGQSRQGTVLRLLSDLEDAGRMARVLVQVDDPFSLQLPQQTKPSLLMGSFLRAQIDGKALDDMIMVPASLVHDNDTVWLFVEDRLQVRVVDVAYRNQSHAYIRSGLQPGDKLVASAISTATDGMPLRVKSASAEVSP